MSNKPITRKEMFMAKASGQNVNTPKPITREEKFLERIAENGGKATSWKDLGEKTVMGDTLTWDGNTEGKDVYAGWCYHVSNVLPMVQDFDNGYSIVLSDGTIYEFDNRAKVDNLEDLLGINGGDVYVMYTEDYGHPVGIYFRNSNDVYVTSLTINGYNVFPRTEITPISTKYLPKSHQFGEKTVMGDTLTWDGNTEGLVVGSIIPPEGDSFNLYRVSNATPTREDFANGFSVNIPDGDTDEYENDEYLYDVAENVLNGDGWFLIAHEDNISLTFSGDNGVVEWNLPKKGIYISSDVGGISLTINGYNGFPRTEIVKIPEKYLPSGGNAVDVVVDNDNNIIDCPLTYGELKEKIESKKPLMITVFREHVYTSDDMSKITYSLYPSEEIIMHYSDGDEGNYIMVKCRSAYYLEFRENGEITFYSVD